MFFLRNHKHINEIKTPSKEVSIISNINREQLELLMRRQKYQNIFADKVFIQTDEALNATEILLSSVGDINVQMDKHEQHIYKTVEVSAEVGAFSEEVNASVEETMRVIDDTIDKAKIGEVAVQNVIDSIEVVYKTSEGMKAILSELSAKSKNIKGIVDTIKGIAKTTHLLSLNANIEAARAGDYGRGFSVVAGEVKKLAESSSKSADEIDKIINEITTVIDETLRIVMEGLGKTIESTDKATEAGKAINDMMSSVEKTKEISEQILKAVREQVDKNHYLVSVIEELFKVSETVKSYNENISVNAVRQHAVLNTLKYSITSLNELSCTKASIEDNNQNKTSFKMLISEVSTFDPAMVTDINTYNVISSLNSGLVQCGSGIEIIGAIAKGWHLESDNVTWNFNLRRDMKFHNGRNITSKDIKYSFERLLSKKLNSPNRWFLSMVKGAESFYNGTSKEVSGIILNGEYGIKFVLDYPYASFLNNLAHISCSILPWENEQDVARKPIGAGPYKFIEMDANRKQIVYEKFSDYALGEALIDNVILSFDSENKVEKLLNGELDYIAVGANDEALLKEKGYDVLKSKSIGIRFISFNFRSKNPIINSKECRQAIYYCVDKEKIIKIGLGNMETPINGVFPESIFSSNSSVKNSRNINKAREFMKQSKCNGGTLTLQIIKNENKKGLHYAVAEVLAENLKEIGINLRLLETSSKEYYSEDNFSKSDLFIYGWIGDSGTADNFIEPLIDINNSSNRGKYNNLEVFNLLQDIKKTKNPYKQKELLCELEKKILSDCPWISISHICTNYAYNNRIKGLKIHPLNFIKLTEIWKE